MNNKPKSRQKSFMRNGNARNRNMVKQQKYPMNLSGPPLLQIFSREDISGVSRQNRKIQMANHFIQAC
jgi:hypothetical protein